MENYEGKVVQRTVMKELSNDKPKWKKSIYELERKCTELNINKWAIPKIGTRLDQCNWAKVMRTLKHAFQKSETEVAYLP